MLDMPSKEGSIRRFRWAIIVNERGEARSKRILATQRQRKHVKPGEEMPLMWGQWAWSADPPAKTVEQRTVIMLVKLARSGDAIERPLTMERPWFEAGDSHHSMPELEASEVTAKTTFGEATVRMRMIGNRHGRLAAIEIEADGTHTLIDGYHFARTAFDSVNILLTAKSGVPLFEAAMLLTAPLNEGTERACRFRVPIPDVKFALMPVPSPIYPMLLTFYAEGVRTNSVFYAFLLFFQLTEFLMSRWQKAVRTVAKECKLNVRNLATECSGENMNVIAPYLKGRRYSDILELYRGTFRNAVAHFNLEWGGAKPFLSRAEDDVSVARDVLRISAAHLLLVTGETLNDFTDAKWDAQDISDRIMAVLQKTTPKGAKPKHVNW